MTRVNTWCIIGCFAALGMSCGAVAPSDSSSDPQLSTVSQAAGSVNGGSYNGGTFNGGTFNGGGYNGGSFNGFSWNGLTFNGGSFNGGSFNGGGYNGFSWNGGGWNGGGWNGGGYNGATVPQGTHPIFCGSTYSGPKNPTGVALSAAEIWNFTYLAKVALGSGNYLLAGGKKFYGNLGLAEGVCDRGYFTDDERQIVTAGLLAHINPGLTQQGTYSCAIDATTGPYAPHQSPPDYWFRSTYGLVPEGIYYGDSATGKLYVCSANGVGGKLAASGTTRDLAFGNGQKLPITYTGECSAACQGDGTIDGTSYCFSDDGEFYPQIVGVHSPYACGGYASQI